MYKCGWCFRFTSERYTTHYRWISSISGMQVVGGVEALYQQEWLCYEVGKEFRCHQSNEYSGNKQRPSSRCFHHPGRMSVDQRRYSKPAFRSHPNSFDWATLGAEDTFGESGQSVSPCTQIRSLGFTNSTRADSRSDRYYSRDSVGHSSPCQISTVCCCSAKTIVRTSGRQREIDIPETAQYFASKREPTS